MTYRGFANAREPAQLPRNAAVLPTARAAGEIVVSFVGDTPLSGAHVYADSGRRYDWRGLVGLRVTIVLKPRVDAALAVREIFDVADFYPTVVDFERQVVGSVVDSSGRVMPWRKGSVPWQALFG